mmetsp:Transcript_2167/g.5104  ORF Transcript_2167/g.5104 Transcript_2167/m.5104 type:complete len:169 (+) Transcript_2167:301-807(+)
MSPANKEARNTVGAAKLGKRWMGRAELTSLRRWQCMDGAAEDDGYCLCMELEAKDDDICWALWRGGWWALPTSQEWRETSQADPSDLKQRRELGKLLSPGRATSCIMFRVSCHEVMGLEGADGWSTFRSGVGRWKRGWGNRESAFVSIHSHPSIWLQHRGLPRDTPSR